jgi:hypothetical protein
VVVVPGILGSRLERNGEPIWGSLGLARALADPEGALGLQGDGFAPEPDVEATGLLGRAAQFPGLAKIDAYDALVDGLRASFELDPTNFVEFAYDWRLSCTVNARLLADRIHPVLKHRRRTHPDAGYVFICHSMGGMIVQHFTDVLGGAHDTKEVVTLGTPFRGAAKTLGVLARGWPRWLPGLRSRFRRLALTLPSVYELLPRYQAIVDGTERRRLAGTDLSLTDSEQERFERASAFHNGLDTAGDRPYDRLVVVGSLQPTEQFARIDNGAVELLKWWFAPDGSVLDERGDGTVPRQSVTPPEWHSDHHALPLSSTHIGLPTARAVFRVLFNTLTATPREEQAEERARLAIDAPDLVEAGTALDVCCEVADGDWEIPLLAEVQAAGAGSGHAPQTPQLRDGILVASFEGLAPGDYRVTVRPAVVMPDVSPVWDLVTIVEPEVERGA